MRARISRQKQALQNGKPVDKKVADIKRAVVLDEEDETVSRGVMQALVQLLIRRHKSER